MRADYFANLTDAQLLDQSVVEMFFPPESQKTDLRIAKRTPIEQMSEEQFGCIYNPFAEPIVAKRETSDSAEISTPLRPSQSYQVMVLGRGLDSYG